MAERLGAVRRLLLIAGLAVVAIATIWFTLIRDTVVAPEVEVPVAALPAVPPPANPPVGAPPSNLPVADRFAMLLAVEQGETTLPPPPAGDRDTALSDEDLDRLARRVAVHLASSPLAADVQRIVAEVSERLVREEIARIRKAAESR